MAVFSSLAEKLQNTLGKLRGRGKLTEQDVKEALREVRLALLEADVNYKVVRDFTARVRERAVGQEVMTSLAPAHQVIKIVHEELTQLMGGSQSKLELASQPPTIIMLVGLQGAGKTTSGAKLARLLHKQGHRPLLVAADVYRPAAIKQLQVLGEQLQLPVFTLGDQVSPVDIAKAAVEHSKRYGNDILILDTAGRLHIDEELMGELRAIDEAVSPHQVLLVVDAMTGQDAVNVASSFNENLDIDGIILTKLDGDARGGAALSIKAVTGKPIKFAATSEKLDGLESFYPDRMASRILGMGDVLTLIERAEAQIDEDKAREMADKLRRADFTFEDFLEQLEQVRNMGPLDQLLDMLPGVPGMKGLRGLQVDERQFGQIEAIIKSMTVEERLRPEIIDGSRKRRIANGSGTKVQDVNRLLKQFNQTRQMLRQLGALDKKAKRRKRARPFSFFQ